MAQLIYKILSLEADAQLQRTGALVPDGIDAADGYVHFSTAAQVVATLEAHFQDHAALMILAIDSATCGDDVRWEASRDGDLFPHLYAPLHENMVAARFRLNAARDGLAAFLQGAAA
jgi:uncharacterized protein (DUF952 family)